MLETLPDILYKEREAFQAELAQAATSAGIRLAAPVQKAIFAALGERNETAAICRGKNGAPEPDPELRDTERVPLVEGEDSVDGDGVPASVRAFFEREVEPHVAGAWIDTSKRDQRDGRVGFVGYEINFNRYFYRYKTAATARRDRGRYSGYREGHSGDAEGYVWRNGLSHAERLRSPVVEGNPIRPIGPVGWDIRIPDRSDTLA